MGAYNILSLQDTCCPKCQHNQNWVIQFKYGHCWMDKYKLSDEVKWGGNDCGERDADIVLVEGIVECTCENCLEAEIYARIFIDNNKLAGACLVLKHILFSIENDGDYLIINK